MIYLGEIPLCLLWECVCLTLLVSCENPDLNVSQREESDGLWDAFLQLVLYSCGTQELDTASQTETHKRTCEFLVAKTGNTKGP